MEETLQHEETTQCIGISTTGLGDHRSHGPIADHALTFKLDHSSGAGHSEKASKRQTFSLLLYIRLNRWISV
jgi:hypothetical protein